MTLRVHAMIFANANGIALTGSEIHITDVNLGDIKMLLWQKRDTLVPLALGMTQTDCITHYKGTHLPV